MPTPDVLLILVPVLVFVAAYLGTAAIRCLARRYGWVAPPRKDRWHTHPTALHGGLGFYPVFLAGALWFLIREYHAGELWRVGLANMPRDVLLASAMLVGSLVMVTVGFLDDVKSFRPATKLLFQLIATSVFVYMGGVFPCTGFQVCDMLITYFWFVGVINAVNMLDNMDGLSSGVVVLAATTLVLLTLLNDELLLRQALAVPLGLVFVAALLGFWLHNRPPATIFMGDSGSLSLGYILAALAVPSALNGFLGIHTEGVLFGPVLVLLIPTTVLAIPIFDTTLVTITRLWRAQKATQGGRDHSSHRLVGIGLSEKRAVWVLYALATFGGGIAVLLQQFPAQSFPLVGLFGMGLTLTGVYLGHTQVHPLAPGQRPPAWTPVVSKLVYKRHAAEVLLDTVLIIICFYGAYLLRFEGLLAPAVMQSMVRALPLTVASCLLAFFCAGIYHGQWRLISVSDVPSYGLGVLGGTVLSLAIVTMVTRFADGHSRSAYIIFGMLLFLAIVGTRLSFRLFDALIRRGKLDVVSTNHKPVLIYGAGKAGKLLHEEIMSNPQMQQYAVVGFIDDDPHQVGHKLCGVPVEHGLEWLGRPWNVLPEIWISSRFIPDERAQQLVTQWDGRTAVRRLRLHVEPVMNGQ
jgi:UDP-GlcNAc:undecaprenyl-phosphate GlcNAc-1-phosphate transferase